MKSKLVAVLAVVLTALFTTAALAGELKDKKDITLKINKEVVEANLLQGVESENFGLRTSSALMLGDIQSSKAVFPLMRMLKYEDDERARIAAALSLYKIGDPVGIYAVKQQARFDSSERVRKLCALFYQEYKNENKEG